MVYCEVVLLELLLISTNNIKQNCVKSLQSKLNFMLAKLYVGWGFGGSALIDPGSGFS